MEKKAIRHLTALFIFSWLALAIFGVLFVRVRIKNLQLKDEVKILEKNSRQLMQEAMLNQKKRQVNEGALDYLEWQFVLKDQVDNGLKQLKARVNAATALKKDKPLLSLLYYNLGLSFTLAMDFNSAIAAFEDAVGQDPKDALSFYNLGLLCSTYRQDPKKAIKYYKKYLELAPANSPKSQEVKRRIEGMEK